MANRTLSNRKRTESSKRTLPIVIEKDDDGYFVHCPALDGCYTQGDTYEEAMKNIKEVIELCLEDDAARDDLPGATSISFCTMEVQV